MTLEGPSNLHGSELASRLRLIVIADEGATAGRALDQVVEAALRGGTPAVQLRLKGVPTGRVLKVARRLHRLTARHGTLFFINDRVDVALAAGADGAHLGPDDPPIGAMRRIVPPDFLLGYSTDDPDEARRAVRDGADYIGCGTVFATTTKKDAGTPIGLEGLDRVASAVQVPVVGIGGIDRERARAVAGTRAAGVAVVGAVIGAQDPGAAVQGLLAPFRSRR